MTNLSTTSDDLVVSLLKGLFGAVPWAGSLLSEAVGSIIPNQRIDRIADVLERVRAKLQRFEEVQADLSERLNRIETRRLLESGIRAAEAASGVGEAEIIAGLIAGGIAGDDLAAEENAEVLAAIEGLSTRDITLLKDPPQTITQRSPADDLRLARLAARGLLRPNGMVGTIDQPFTRTKAGAVVLYSIEKAARL